MTLVAEVVIVPHGQPGQERPDDLALLQSELEDCNNRQLLRGRKVTLEHDDSREVGEIVSTFIEDGSLKGVVRIEDATVAREILSGQLDSVSLSHFLTKPEGSPSSVRFHNLGVCRKGKRPGARVTRRLDASAGSPNECYVENAPTPISKFMATPAQESAPAAPVPVPVQAPAPVPVPTQPVGGFSAEQMFAIMQQVLNLQSRSVPAPAPAPAAAPAPASAPVPVPAATQEETPTPAKKATSVSRKRKEPEEEASDEEMEAEPVRRPPVHPSELLKKFDEGNWEALTGEDLVTVRDYLKFAAANEEKTQAAKQRKTELAVRTVFPDQSEEFVKQRAAALLKSDPEVWETFMATARQRGTKAMSNPLRHLRTGGAPPAAVPTPAPVAQRVDASASEEVDPVSFFSKDVRSMYRTVGGDVSRLSQLWVDSTRKQA